MISSISYVIITRRSVVPHFFKRGVRGEYLKREPTVELKFLKDKEKSIVKIEMSDLSHDVGFVPPDVGKLQQNVGFVITRR